jgi:hypothetical protein
MGEKLKAILLIPAAYAGAFTVLAFDIPPRTAADVVIPIALLVPVYVGLIVILRWMWRRPPERRYLGHTRRTWAFLLATAYIAGVVCMGLK